MWPQKSDKNFFRKLFTEKKLSDILKTPVISVGEYDPFSSVYEKFHDHGIRHLPVVNETNKVIGLITQRDFYRIHSPRRLLDGENYYDKETLNSFILKNVMTPNPFTLTPEHSIADCLKAMADFKYGCVPVVNQYKELVGIVTNTDILKFASDILADDKK